MKTEEPRESVLWDLERVLGKGSAYQDQSGEFLVAVPRADSALCKLMEYASKKELTVFPRFSWDSSEVMEYSGKFDILLDLRKINLDITFDKENMVVHCGPGVTYSEVAEVLGLEGYRLGAYPRSSSEMLLGDWIMRAAPSVDSFRYGPSSEQVRSIRVVLPNGDQIETGFETLSNFGSGYDLNRLFTGSKLIFGLPARLSLKTYPVPPERTLKSYSFTNRESLMNFLQGVVSLGHQPDHIMFWLSNPRESVEGEKGEGPVGRVTVSFEGSREECAIVAKTLENLATSSGCTDCSEEAESEFALRFDDSMVRSKPGSQSLGGFELLIGELDGALADLVESCKDQADLFLFGSLVDRNSVSVSICSLKTSAPVEELAEQVRTIMMSHNGFPDGSVQPEGSGPEKESYEAGLNILLRLRSAADPKNILFSERLDKLDLSITPKSKKREIIPDWPLLDPVRQMVPRKRDRMTEEQKKELSKLVGEDRVALDPFRIDLYSHDLAPLPKLIEIPFEMKADAVVRPASAEDVAKTVKFASSRGIPVTARGGASWGFGGAVPAQGGIQLDLSDLDSVENIDSKSYLAVCEPCVTWERLENECQQEGLRIGACPSSAPVATVGGWTATGGAGMCSYSHGTSGSQVHSLEVVMPDGSLLDTGNRWTRAGAQGLNLNGLFIGSEGTLGIITKVMIKLHPAHETVKPLAYSFSNLKKVQEALQALATSHITPLNISFFEGSHFEHQRALGKDAPKSEAMLCITLGAPSALAEIYEQSIDSMMSAIGAKKESSDVASHIWEERSYELRIRRLGPGGTLGEAVIPIGTLAEMVARTRALIEELGMVSALNGVVIDRNTVAFMPYYILDEREMIRSLAAMGYVRGIFKIAMELAGRPSGLGRWFASNLEKMHGREGAQLIRRIKEEIDPDYLMNPGKFTEMRARFGVGVPGMLMDIGLDLLQMVKKGFPEKRVQTTAGG